MHFHGQRVRVQGKSNGQTYVHTWGESKGDGNRVEGSRVSRALQGECTGDPRPFLPRVQGEGGVVRPPCASSAAGQAALLPRPPFSAARAHIANICPAAAGGRSLGVSCC